MQRQRLRQTNVGQGCTHQFIPFFLRDISAQPGQFQTAAGNHVDVKGNSLAPTAAVRFALYLGKADGIFIHRALFQCIQLVKGGVVVVGVLQVHPKAVAGSGNILRHHDGGVAHQFPLVIQHAADAPEQLEFHMGIGPENHIPTDGVFHLLRGNGVHAPVQVDGCTACGQVLHGLAVLVHRLGNGRLHIVAHRQVHLCEHRLKLRQLCLTHDVLGLRGIGDGLGSNFKIVFCAALEVNGSRFIGENHNGFTVFQYDFRVAVIDGPVIVVLIRVRRGALNQLRLAVAGIDIQLNGLFQHRSHLIAGVHFRGLADDLGDPVIVIHQGSVGGHGLHRLAEHQTHIRIRQGTICIRAVILGELLGHRGLGVILGMDGDFANAGGIVSSLVLGHIVQVVGLLVIQAGDVKADILALGHVHLAALEGIHARRHLELGLVTGPVHRPGLACQRLGIDLALLDHNPVQGAGLIEVGIQAHGSLFHLVDGGLRVKLRGRSVHRGKAQLFDRRTGASIDIGKPQVEVIRFQFFQRHIIDIKGIGLVLGHVQCTVAQIAGNGIGFEILCRGRCRTFGKYSVIQAAGLGSHCGHLGGNIGNPRHVGIARRKVRGRVVRRTKGNDLYRAAVLPSVHKDGRQIVGAAGGESSDFVRGRLIGPADGHAAPLDNLGAIGRGVNQIIRAHRTIRHRSNRPVHNAFFISADADRCRSGSQIGHLGIARQNSGVCGGLRRRRAVHVLSINDSRLTRTDDDFIGQHGHGAAGGIDRQLADVAVTGDGGGCIQVDLFYLCPSLNVKCGAGGSLINGNALGLSGAQAQIGFGCQVDDILDIAGQLQRAAVLAVQFNAQSAAVGGGVVLQKGVGPDAGHIDNAVTLQTHGHLSVFHIVQHQLGAVDVAQHHAVLAAFADAAAADDNFAQDRHIFQQDVALGHTGGDVQVTGNDRVAQHHAGSIDGHIAVDIPQGMDTRGLHRRANGPDQHNGRLAPGDGSQRPEGTVAIAVDNLIISQRRNETAAPIADIAAVGKVGIFTRRSLEHQIPGQHGRRLLPGNLPVRGEGVLGRALYVSYIVGNGHILRVPIAGFHIRKGHITGTGIPEGPVDNGDEFRPGDVAVRAQIAFNIAPQEAPFHHLVEIGVLIIDRMGRGQAGGDHRQQCGRHQNQGQHPPEEF